MEKLHKTRVEFEFDLEKDTKKEIEYELKL